MTEPAVGRGGVVDDVLGTSGPPVVEVLGSEGAVHGDDPVAHPVHVVQEGPVVRGQPDRYLRQHARPVFTRAGRDQGGGQGPGQGREQVSGRLGARQRVGDAMPRPAGPLDAVVVLSVVAAHLLDETMHGDTSGAVLTRGDVVALPAERVEQESEVGREVVRRCEEFLRVTNHRRQFGAQGIPRGGERLRGGGTRAARRNHQVGQRRSGPRVVWRGSEEPHRVVEMGQVAAFLQGHQHVGEEFAVAGAERVDHQTVGVGVEADVLLHPVSEFRSGHPARRCRHVDAERARYPGQGLAGVVGLTRQAHLPVVRQRATGKG